MTISLTMLYISQLKARQNKSVLIP